MDTQIAASSRERRASASQPQAMRLDTGYPLQSSTTSPQSASTWSPSPTSAGPPQDNGIVRTSSRRRKVSGQGYTKNVAQPEQLPPAPDVPRAPPVSYRDPYNNNENLPIRNNASKSFAARARAIPDSMNPALAEASIMDNGQDGRRPRRASVDQPSGVSYREVQYPNGEFSSPLSAGPSSTQWSIQPRGTSQRKTTDSEYDQGTANPNLSRQYSNARSPPSGSQGRRVSESRMEWAADRSPLQKLEVKLNDISKEEKRARVQEAEQLLRESKASRAKSQENPDAEPDVYRRSSKRAPARTKENINRDIQSQPRQPEHQEPTEAYETKSRSKATSTRDQHGAQKPQGNRESTAQEQISQGPPLATPEYVVHDRKTEDVHRRSVQASVVGAETPRDVRFKRDSYIGGANSSNGGVLGRMGSTHRRESELPKEEAGFQSDKVVQQPTQQPRRLQKQRQPDDKKAGKVVSEQQQNLYAARAQPSGAKSFAPSPEDSPDPMPGNISHGHGHGLKYEIPPQTAAGIDARQRIGFGTRQDNVVGEVPTREKLHLSNVIHGNHRTSPIPPTNVNGPPRHLDEWRNGGIAQLTIADSIAETPSKETKKAWWEKENANGRRRQSASNAHDQGSYQGDGVNEGAFDSASFSPPLYLKCGPLLRYTGLRREKKERSRSRRDIAIDEHETWRGSVMIVTVDADSSYDPAPTLRLFHQPMDPLPPPPQDLDEGSEGLSPEYKDPIAGLPKISRTGRTVYVKPVEDLEAGVDVSRLETDDGLYEETRTANVPTSYGKADELLGRSSSSSIGKIRANGRVSSRRSGRYKDVRGVRLHVERGCTFWRFNLEVELGERQSRIAYRINEAPAIGFWVPAKGQTMNVMFHSCNGFSLSVDPANFSGPDPLWRDVLNRHQFKPFHVMIGGGDQIYNDAVMKQTTHFQEWLRIKNPHHKHEAEFSPDMQEELESFYLERYSMWFSQGLFGMANSQIPMVNVWDDHDIIDGFGSYPHHFMRSPVFCGLGNIAFKYYMLFQHQSVVDEGEADEPSWLLGKSPGPYINEFSRSVFMFLGKHVAFLGLDCRTERMREEILSEASYDLAFERCKRELVKGETKHLIVLLGVPIAYPRLVWLENLLTSRAMDPVKALARTGLMGGFLNQFDGGVEILDDLDDHWTARNHKEERNWFLQYLQDLAAEKSVRITILGGDVHLAAVGQFYSNPKLKIPKDKDHRYMPNVISSAIVNTRPPEMMGDILNKRNKTHHLDHDTDENMIPMFTHDVDGKPRNNKRLLPRRNWCSIREYHPGSTPPPTPPSSSPSSEDLTPPQTPLNRITRSLSFAQSDSKPATLLRRLSQRGPPPPSSNNYPPSFSSRPSTATSPPPEDSYFPPQPKSPTTNGSTMPMRHSSAPAAYPRPGNFHRRPTNMTEKAATKGGPDLPPQENDHVNLQGGLDIVLHCEKSQKDPAGKTEPYRLLVPALWYQGEEEAIGSSSLIGGGIEKRQRVVGNWLKRGIGSVRRPRTNLASGQGKGNWGGDLSGSNSRTPSISENGGAGRGDGVVGAKEGRSTSVGFGVRRLLSVGHASGGGGHEAGRTIGQPSDFDDDDDEYDDDDGAYEGARGGGGFYGVRNEIHGGRNSSPHVATTAAGGDGGKGYSGIEAYREKGGWRRFF